MAEFKKLVITRRSYRKFTDEEIDPEQVEIILRAALISPTSKNKRDINFIVVDDKSKLEKLADAKDNGGHFLKDAPLAVVMVGNPMENDCWVEDGAIAAISMQYQAEELGLGSCWVQIKGRGLSDGTTADEVTRGVLDIPDNLSVLCIVAFGHKPEIKKAHNDEQLLWDRVHLNSY